jgi:hypothetical protein
LSASFSAWLGAIIARRARDDIVSSITMTNRISTKSISQPRAPETRFNVRRTHTAPKKEGKLSFPLFSLFPPAA